MPSILGKQINVVASNKITRRLLISTDFYHFLVSVSPGNWEREHGPLLRAGSLCSTCSISTSAEAIHEFRRHRKANWYSTCFDWFVPKGKFLEIWKKNQLLHSNRGAAVVIRIQWTFLQEQVLPPFKLEDCLCKQPLPRQLFSYLIAVLSRLNMPI